MSFVFNPIDPDFLQDPYPTYQRLREEDPVHRHPAGFVAVSRHRDVAHVLKTPELFSSAAMGGGRMRPTAAGRTAPTTGSLIGEDPPLHTRMRNIVSRGFTPRRIAALEPRIRAVADELFAKFEGRGHCDLTAELANPLPVTVIAELLGLDPERRDDFKRWSTALIIGSTQGTPQRGGEDWNSVVEFRRYMESFVERRRAEPGDDLVSILIHAEEEEGILDAEGVIGFASLLLAAGSETTTNLIGNAVLALLANPDVLDAVLREPARIPQLVEETLRYDPPVQLLMRLTTGEVEIGGVSVNKGAMVMPLIGAANRDGDVFPDPDRFDLDRETEAHLGFGFGHHFCLGASLARLEGTIALEGVVSRLENFRLATDRVERHGSFLVRGPGSLPLAFDV